MEDKQTTLAGTPGTGQASIQRPPEGGSVVVRGTFQTDEFPGAIEDAMTAGDTCMFSGPLEDRGRTDYITFEVKVINFNESSGRFHARFEAHGNPYADHPTLNLDR